jgi:hypothetical protein
MYGIVNKSIEEMVILNFGTDTWEVIKERSGVKEDFFLSNEPYDDSITYQLAFAASDVLNITVTQVLNAFGEFWILKTGKEKYGSLMDAGGASLKEFLINLPSFHNRIMFMYPNLDPPEFKTSDIMETSINIHYFSHRAGLMEFVRGLLIGLSKMFGVVANVVHIKGKEDGIDHEVFKVSW